MFAPFVLAFTAVAGALDDESGFGGTAPLEVVDDVAAAVAPTDAIVDEAPPTRAEFRGGGGGRALAVFPPEQTPPAPKKTQLELDLERARIDPILHPLVALRVEVARARMAYEDGRKAGLFSVKEEEEALAKKDAVLQDVERIALHRLNVCQSRLGRAVSVKNYRMTAAGPVKLTTAELLAQASAVDPDGCERINLIDAALVARVRRAHELQELFRTRKFGFHEMSERRAFEREQAAIANELAKEDLPVISLPGAADPYGRR